ncbi:MAG: hypothetical protein KUG77_05495 [Nannocystaceae bacterium]|nr:hypothetical protein [Nannocystaceae bacterium]
MRPWHRLAGSMLVFVLAAAGCAKTPATISSPDVFEVAGPEVEVATLVEQAAAQDRLLLVWAVGPEYHSYPHEFDQDPLEPWVREHAIAVRVPSRDVSVSRPIAARGHALIVYRDGHAVADLRHTLDATATTRVLTGLAVGKPMDAVVVSEARRRIAEPEDVRRRHAYARMMISNGDLETAEEVLRWLYVHGEDHSPNFAHTRGSFLLLTIANFSREVPESVERFEALMSVRDFRRFKFNRFAFTG